MPETERFSDLYLDEVAGGSREASVLFADLRGFTSFSEHHHPTRSATMLNTYFEAVVPAVRNEGARLDKFIGDAVMVTFNVASEQPDHARAGRPRGARVPGGGRRGRRRAPGLAALPGRA